MSFWYLFLLHLNDNTFPWDTCTYKNWQSPKYGDFNFLIPLILVSQRYESEILFYGIFLDLLLNQLINHLNLFRVNSLFNSGKQTLEMC